MQSSLIFILVVEKVLQCSSLLTRQSGLSEMPVSDIATGIGVQVVGGRCCHGVPLPVLPGAPSGGPVLGCAEPVLPQPGLHRVGGHLRAAPCSQLHLGRDVLTLPLEGDNVSLPQAPRTRRSSEHSSHYLQLFCVGYLM